MAFKTNVLFKNEDLENIVTTIFILIGLKSFEFIIKTLLTSTRGESVNTGKYSLSVATDQAFNPLNYIKWIRGTSDFQSFRCDGELKEFRKPIPLNRATLAVLICLLTLVAEGFFFFGTMSKNRDLYNTDFTLSVQTSNKHVFRKFTHNYCAPISVDTGRAKLTAVFAFCNEQRSSGGVMGFAKLAASRNLYVDFKATAFAQSVVLKDMNSNNSIISKTMFSILVPDADEHLVVPYNGSNALNAPAHHEIMNDFVNKRHCQVNTTNRASGRYELKSCQHEVNIGELMRLVLSYNELNTTHGTVGHEVGNSSIAMEGMKLKLGSIEENKMSAEVLLAVSLSLFLIAFICNLFVKNYNSEVIAAMMREKTGQDMRVPAFSMDDEVIHLDRNSFDEEGRNWYRTIHTRSSIETQMGSSS